MTKHRTGLFSKLVFAAGISFAAFSAFSQPIKVGWLSSLTGPLSSSAIAENEGVMLAVEEINKSGGILGRPIELLTRDTAGDPTKAVNFAQQLAFSDKVNFVIGPVNSGEGLAATPILAKAGVPTLVIGAVDELTDAKKFPRAFRMINTNSQWISSANDYALNVLKAKKIAIIADTTGYGTASAKAATEMLEKAGVKPVYSVLVDNNKTDLVDEMTKARNAGADIVMPWTAATGLLARLLNARGEMGWDVNVVGHPALMAAQIRKLLNKPEYWDKTYAAGYVSTTYLPDGKLPERTQALVDKIRAKQGNGEIDVLFWWIALGYDTVKMVEHAVKTAGSTDPAKIQKVLEATKNFPGVYGVYSWSDTQRNGFPDSGMIVNTANTFKDGSFKPAPR